MTGCESTMMLNGMAEQNAPRQNGVGGVTKEMGAQALDQLPRITGMGQSHLRDWRPIDLKKSQLISAASSR